MPKRQPGVQIDLNSSELQDEIKTIVKLGTAQKIVFYKKTANIPETMLRCLFFIFILLKKWVIFTVILWRICLEIY